MVEDFLSNELKSLDEDFNEKREEIEALSKKKAELSSILDELNNKLDPQMEVFSPISINKEIKDKIGEINIEIDKLNLLISEKTKSFDVDNKRRSNLVSILNEYRTEKKELERFRNNPRVDKYKEALSIVKEADGYLMEFIEHDEVTDEIHMKNISVMNILSVLLNED